MTDRPHPDLDAPLTSTEAEEMRRVQEEDVARAQTFGQRIRALRRERGITLRDAAEKIGRDFTYLSKIENGRCLPPSAEVIVALADILGGDAEELAILGDKPPIAVVRRQLSEAVAEIRRLRAALRASQGVIHEGLHGGRATAPEHQGRCEKMACRKIRAALAGGEGRDGL